MPSQHLHLILLLIFLIQFATADNANNCRVPADLDVLGLGVRLGLYFQTASTILISLVRPKEAKESWLPTALFFSAFFVAVVYSVAHSAFSPGSVISCTWYPILIFVALYPYDFGSFSDDSKGKRGQLLLVLWISSVSLNIWFWFKGLDVQNDAQIQCIEPRVFFFANLSATGGIRVVFRIFCLIPAAILMAIIVLGFANSRRKTHVARDEEKAARAPALPIKDENPVSRQSVVSTSVESPLKVPAPSPQPVATSSHVAEVSTEALTTSTGAAPIAINEEAERRWGGALFLTLVLIFYIVASELQLKWNRLDGINSLSTTGQIIPLVIGTLSLLRTFYLLKDANWAEFYQTLMSQ